MSELQKNNQHQGSGVLTNQKQEFTSTVLNNTFVDKSSFYFLDPTQCKNCHYQYQITSLFAFIILLNGSMASHLLWHATQRTRRKEPRRDTFPIPRLSRYTGHTQQPIQNTAPPPPATHCAGEELLRSDHDHAVISPVFLATK